MKASKSTQKHELWLAYAEDDLQIAKLLLDAPTGSVTGVLFHSQQCTEKALKSVLIYHEIKYRKIHDLVELVNSCPDLDKEFLNLKVSAFALNPFAVDVRYPETYHIDPYELLVKEAVNHADGILKHSKNHIDSHKIIIPISIERDLEHL